jgi:hypothetical protein
MYGVEEGAETLFDPVSAYLSGEGGTSVLYLVRKS